MTAKIIYPIEIKVKLDNVFKKLEVFYPEKKIFSFDSLCGKQREILSAIATELGVNYSQIIHDYGYASVGASGAIFGVFGAFTALVYYTRNNFPQLKQVILPLVIISVIMTFLSSGVNAVAHLGGLATGFVLGLYFFNPKNHRKLRAI